MPRLCAQEPSTGDQPDPQLPREVAPAVMIVIGAAGEEEYGKEFREWANRIQRVCQSTNCSLVDGTAPLQDHAPDHDRAALLSWIADPQYAGASERWLILLGHGTHDANATKFNLRGADISAEQLAKALSQADARWIIVACSSSSAPFLQQLSGPNRVIITATKSGAEQNYSRFGDHFSRALGDEASDLDHDRSVSVLEAFLAASGKVAEFYRDQDRLATEQALLDDNGDKRGTPATFFRGIRPVKAAAEGLELDGRLASRLGLFRFGTESRLTPEQLAERSAIEDQIEQLRVRKKDLARDDYYQQLERLLLQLAKVSIE